MTAIVARPWIYSLTAAKIGVLFPIPRGIKLATIQQLSIKEGTESAILNTESGLCLSTITTFESSVSPEELHRFARFAANALRDALGIEVHQVVAKSTVELSVLLRQSAEPEAVVATKALNVVLADRVRAITAKHSATSAPAPSIPRREIPVAQRHNPIHLRTVTTNDFKMRQLPPGDRE